MRERKNGVIEWTMRHYQITLLVITVLVGLGILGLVDMPNRNSRSSPSAKVWSWVFTPGDFRRGGGAAGQAFERYLFTFKEVKKKKTYPCQGMEWCT